MDLIDSPPAVISSGEILLAGSICSDAASRAPRKVNGKTISMIFQDPLGRAQPGLPVGWQIAETMRVHGVDRQATARRRAMELLARVGIPDPERRARQLPAPVLRRPAPADHDRHGARDEARHHHRRRADHALDVTVAGPRC